LATLALAGFASLMLMVLAPAALAGQGFRLDYQGGPVLHSSRPYLVLWTPPGESVPASSESLVERFMSDAAADSGRSSNVFGVLRQYYDRAGFADYRQAFDPSRQVVVDSRPYPPRDTTFCPDVSASYPTCISDVQIQSELQRLVAADRLPTAGPASKPELSANAPIYFVLLPSDVTLCRVFASLCAAKTASGCAYHSYFDDSRKDVVLYAPILTLCHATFAGIGGPKIYQVDGHPLVQEPNGEIADTLLTPVSHELSETTTDPLNPFASAWLSSTSIKFEVGDVCGGFGSPDPAKGLNPNAYLPTLGGNAGAATLFDQLINGHPYYIQSEWSNGEGTCETRPSAGRIAPRFAVSRGAHTAGAALIFNLAASTSRNAISSATWNFGDGSKTAFLPGRTARNRLKHRYRRAGHYTVTLTLVDTRGNLQTTTRRLTVHAH
jgi:hypothetical protein